MNVRRARGPHNRSTPTHKRNSLLLLCALALGTLLASAASGQVVEGYIQLPDSFGVFRAPYKVAWDYTPGAERLFVIGESSEVLVVDAISFRKLKRIPILARSICYSSVQDKLYVAELTSTTLAVVDGSSYQVIKQVPLGDNANWLFHNPIVDRVYCGTYHWRVIDCASDSVVDTVDMDGWGACRAFDSLHNKLYVSTGSALKVIDCYSDSVVATVPRVAGATAICYNLTSDRVYATANTGGTWPDETLYVVDTRTDSVVSQVPMPDLAPTFYPTIAMCTDPVQNRVFTISGSVNACVDCEANTLLWYKGGGNATDVACVPDLNRVYLAAPLHVYSMDGSTGDYASSVSVDGRAAPLVYLDRVRRLYCLANFGQLAAIDCGIDTAMGQVPLDAFVDASAERVCLDTVGNKLYFAFNMHSGYVGVVDCSARLVESYQMCRYPQSMVHDALDDKLFVSTWKGWGSSGVSVFDCKSDSLVKVIPTPYVKGGLRWHPELNKAYAGAIDSSGHNYVVVIDCAADSVARTLVRGSQNDEFSYSLLSTESDQFWNIAGHGYTVVDCLRDSIVMDTVTDDLAPGGVCFSDADRKVYVAHGSSELVVLSMESLRPTRRIQLTGAGHAVDAMIHVAAAGKVYVAVMNGPSNTDTVYVVDTGADSVVSRFDAGHIIRAMCDDATGRYVYCTALIHDSSSTARETLLVIDTRCDSIVSGASLPGVTWGAGEWLLPNRRTGRIYVGQDPNGKLLVIRDSVVIGVEEWRDVTDPPVALQTIVNRAVPFRSAARADLFDASGRRAAVLRSGPSDINHLAPGVYFVRQASSVRRDASSVTKVVVTR